MVKNLGEVIEEEKIKTVNTKRAISSM